MVLMAVGFFVIDMNIKFVLENRLQLLRCTWESTLIKMKLQNHLYCKREPLYVLGIQAMMDLIGICRVERMGSMMGHDIMDMELIGLLQNLLKY